MEGIVKISFGLIVLNGYPFITYNLKSIYPFAHEIIVVEGACPSASNVATFDGHSIDGTLQLLYDFKKNHDPQNKIIIVKAVDKGYENGFWPEKDQMSQAYAERASGNYLWQIDCDEFYRKDDMEKIINLLKEGVDAISFPTITFWGSIRYCVSGFRLISDNARRFDRLFAWGNGYTYKTHRPPTVIDENGIDTKKKRYVSSDEMEVMGIYLYHYSLVYPLHVGYKMNYYATKVNYKYSEWYKNNYLIITNPFRVHNEFEYISWLEKYDCVHPEYVEVMNNDIENRVIIMETRYMFDAQKLVDNNLYYITTHIFKQLAYALKYKPLNYFRTLYFKVRNQVLLVIRTKFIR